MKKPKNLYVWPIDMNKGGGMLVEGGYRAERNKGEKKWDNFNSVINEIYFKNKNKF